MKAFLVGDRLTYPGLTIYYPAIGGQNTVIDGVLCDQWVREKKGVKKSSFVYCYIQKKGCTRKFIIRAFDALEGTKRQLIEPWTREKERLIYRDSIYKARGGR